jgi:hypothetical protein
VHNEPTSLLDKLWDLTPEFGVDPAHVIADKLTDIQVAAEGYPVSKQAGQAANVHARRNVR